MKIKRYLLGLLLFIIWGALVSYSMLSTSASQYKKLLSIKMDYREPTKNTTVSNVNINKKISILEEANKVSQSELDVLLERTKSINNMQSRYTYKNTSSNTESRIDSLKNSITVNNNIIMQLLDSLEEINTKEQDTFKLKSKNVYEYFSDLLNNKISPIYIQFILSLFPSIFVDIVAPINLSIFLHRKRKAKDSQ